MTGTTSRLAKSKASSTIVGVFLILTGVALMLYGLLVRPEASVERIWFVATGCVIAFGGIGLMLALLILIKIESSAFRFYNQLLDMHELSTRQNELLMRLVENSALSDAAKSLANRDHECEALRAAIRADVRMEKWDVALSLADEMEKRFGYSEDAESLREEVNEARVAAMRKRLHQAAELIERQLDAHEWEKALHEIERLHRALPDEPRVARLRTLYTTKRAARKAELLKQWNNAVERNDVDSAIDVLKDLDVYLTREEARALEEKARSVFKAKLLQLGTQFQFAVNEQRWRDALEIGIQIIEEFPNSRMSQEVEQAMDGLRARAGLQDVDVEVVASKRGRSSPT